MKVTLYVAVVALLFTATSCAKKTPTDTATSADLTASEHAPASMPQDRSDFANRKPFKYTVTTDINIDYEDYEDEVIDEIKILVAINDEGGKYPIQYDLDCDSDGMYEFMGLTTPNQYCTYKRDNIMCKSH